MTYECCTFASPFQATATDRKGDPFSGGETPPNNFSSAVHLAPPRPPLLRPWIPRIVCFISEI